jgi:methyl-accepting chemotaxis protein
MKISELKSAIREMIIGELTVVDKMTTPDEAATIAKDEKKDINTVKDAITTAKKSGKSVTIAEDDALMKWLKLQVI